MTTLTAEQLAVEALRKSEARYRTLFEAVDAGFCVMEMEFDEQLRCVNYRYAEVNPAFELQTGVANASGKWIKDLVPDLEQHWFDIYGHVTLMGEATRFEAPADPVGRWYDVHAFRIGESEQRQVAILFNDITERKRAEMVLRESEERQAFLLTFSDDLRALTDVDSIGAHAVRRRAEHLRLDRCFLGTHSPANDMVAGPQYVSPDLAVSKTEYRLSDFAESVRRIQAGTVVVNDVPGNMTMDPLDRASMAAMALGAFINASVRRGDQGVLWSLIAMSPTPRDWAASEITLVEDVAERTWAAVERARAEATLRAAEESHRAIFTGTSAGFLVLAPDAPRFTITDVNDAYLNMTNTRHEDLIGRALFEVFPENSSDSNATYVRDLRASLDRVLATKRRDVLPRLKYDIPKPGGGFEERWWDPIQTPLHDSDGRHGHYPPRHGPYRCRTRTSVASGERGAAAPVRRGGTGHSLDSRCRNLAVGVSDTCLRDGLRPKQKGSTDRRQFSSLAGPDRAGRPGTGVHLDREGGGWRMGHLRISHPASERQDDSLATRH